MQIKVNIDQAACLGRGLDTEKSYAKIEIKPATLAPSVRKWLAKKMINGYELDIAMAMPLPTQKDLEDYVLQILNLEQAQAQREAENKKVFRDALSPEEQCLLDQGMLPTAALLTASHTILKPLLQQILAIDFPQEYCLHDVRITSKSEVTTTNWDNAKFRPMLICNLIDDSKKSTLNMQEPHPWSPVASGRTWQNSYTKEWVAYAQQLTSLGIKLSEVLTEDIGGNLMLHLAVAVNGLPTDIDLWLLGFSRSVCSTTGEIVLAAADNYWLYQSLDTEPMLAFTELMNFAAKRIYQTQGFDWTPANLQNMRWLANGSQLPIVFKMDNSEDKHHIFWHSFSVAARGAITGVFASPNIVDQCSKFEALLQAETRFRVGKLPVQAAHPSEEVAIQIEKHWNRTTAEDSNKTRTKQLKVQHRYSQFKSYKRLAWMKKVTGYGRISQLFCKCYTHAKDTAATYQGAVVGACALAVLVCMCMLFLWLIRPV